MALARDTYCKPNILGTSEVFLPVFVALKYAMIINSCVLFLKYTDIFRGPNAEKVRLQGLEHVLQFTELDGKIFLRSYRFV